MRKKTFIAIGIIIALSILPAKKVDAQANLLGMIEMNFCNNAWKSKELDLTTQALEKTPICVEFTNKSNSGIIIHIEFLDSVITSDNFKDRACNASDRPKMQFGNFMLPYSGEIRLPPKETIQKIYQIAYPIGFSWLSHGCIAYYIAGMDIQNSEMLTVRIRSVKYIDVFVTDRKAIQTIKVSQSPILTKTDNEYILSFGLENQGNIEEKIHITSILSNIFGYQKEFTFDTIIPANTWVILTTPSFVLPIYGWPFRFKSKISYTPQFNFNITNGKHPSEIYKGGIKNSQTLLFVRTRQSWLTLGIIMLILYSIFHRRKKPSDKKTPETLQAK